MYPTYVVRPSACAGRQMARRAPHCARSLSSNAGPSFFPPALFGARHHPFFGPPSTRGRQDVFDHFDDFVNRSLEGFIAPNFATANQAKASFWQPRFDVKELDDSYQLRGELPGVDAKDLEVEFIDANTLVIRGQTVNERSEGQAPAQQRQAEAAQQDGPDVNMITSEKAAEAAETASNAGSESSYVQPTVEDEADAERRESVGTEATADAQQKASNAEHSVAQEKQQQPQSKYWISERSTGSFARTFEFPGRVDAESVSASLKNGILDVVVPKAKAPEARKIEVN